MAFKGQFFPLGGIEDRGITITQARCSREYSGGARPGSRAEQTRTSCMRTPRCSWEGAGGHFNLPSRRYNRNSSRNNKRDEEQAMAPTLGRLQEKPSGRSCIDVRLEGGLEGGRRRGPSYIESLPLRGGKGQVG